MSLPFFFTRLTPVVDYKKISCTGLGFVGDATIQKNHGFAAGFGFLPQLCPGTLLRSVARELCLHSTSREEIWWQSLATPRDPAALCGASIFMTGSAIPQFSAVLCGMRTYARPRVLSIPHVWQ